MVTETTKKANANRMNLIKRLLKEDNFDFVLNPSRTIKAIKKKYSNKNSQKTYISAVMSYVRDNVEDNKILLDKYNKVHKQLREQVKSELSNNTKSDKFIEWQDIIEYREELKENAQDAKSFLDYLILSLYSYNPPLRSDYGQVKITKRNMKGTENLLIMGKNPRFIIKSYKTAKTNGDIIIPVKGELLNIIKYWNDNYNSNPKFLLNMSDNQLVKNVQRILNNKFNKGSINVLRKSYLTNVFNNFSDYSNADLEHITHLMGNSVSTAIESYRKVNKN